MNAPAFRFDAGLRPRGNDDRRPLRASCLGAVLALVGGLGGCLEPEPFSGDGSGGGDGDGGSGGTWSTSDGGASSTGPSGGGGTGGAVTDPEIPAMDDPYEPAPPARVWSDAERSALGAAIDAALDAIPGATHSALVVGLDSGQVLYERTPDAARKPASNTKLFTTALGLSSLGVEHRPSARIYGALSGNAIAGDVTLVVEHDPSTSDWFGEGARQSLDAAADALRSAGITSVTGNAVTRGEGVYGGNSVGTIAFASERAEIASAFLQALEARGIAVTGSATNAAGFDPPAAPLLLEVGSAGQGSIAHAINVPSHNEFADLWMHHLGWLASGESTYAAGFAAMQTELDRLGVPHTGLLLNDGSGLSHDNRVTARQIVDLFVAMRDRSEWPAWVDSMAVAGLRGTIANRMTGPDTAGRFFGKTGTLTGVVALSGVLFHRHDGGRYVASFLTNNVSDATVARSRLDQAIAAIGANRREEPPVPEAPTMLALTDDANGATALASFTPVDGATGYLLWRSPDGLSFSREDARLVSDTTHRTRCLGDSLFVRVSAVGPGGESVPSSTFAVSCTDEGARVLVVDGNERHSAQPVPENPLRAGHRAAVEHAAAAGTAVASASHEAIDAGTIALDDYDLVLWMAGRESVADESFSIGEQERVRAFVDAGGRLFVSGAEVAYDLLAEGSVDDAAFAEEVLGIGYGGDDAGTTFVLGDAAGSARLARFSRLGTSEIAYPDVLVPASGGTECLEYVGATVGAAGVRSTKGSSVVVTLGVPLESIEDPTLRSALVALAAAP